MKRVFMSCIGVAILASASLAHAQRAVVLVRHAELQGAAMAPEKSLGLSEAGEARAKRLAAMLKDAGVGAVYVTDFARTSKTAEPLVKEIGKPPIALPKGDPRELVQRLRKDHRGETVLLVGHTDTLPGLLKELGAAADVKIEREDYGNVFVVVPNGTGASLLRLRY